jgi:NifB/MoaA-like Fe-S oxidoreductase
MIAEDWAHSLGMPQEEVARTLASLEEWSLSERLEVGGLTLFRLTTSEDRRQKVEEFLYWRKKWAAQIGTVSDMLKIEPARR